MSTKSSTAALDPFCQRLLLPQRRAPRHPASGQKLHERKSTQVGIQESGQTIVKMSTGIPGSTLISKLSQSFCKRLIVAAALAACVFVAPVIATASRVPLHEVRLPRIDSRVVENLLRWADNEKDSWSEEV
jgi:hypothetical protein